MKDLRTKNKGVKFAGIAALAAALISTSVAGFVLLDKSGDNYVAAETEVTTASSPLTGEENTTAVPLADGAQSRATTVVLDQAQYFDITSGGELRGISAAGYKALASGGVTPTSNYEIAVPFSIAYPQNVTSVKEGAFAECVTLTEMTVTFVGGNKSAVTVAENTFFSWVFGNNWSDEARDHAIYARQASGTLKYYGYIPETLTRLNITGGNVLAGCVSSV
ncbi:MAG: hypothetical protein NC131_15480, partial [Roseburia sp.]|nr:hypothetical protein [Roseburia sp.]